MFLIILLTITLIIIIDCYLLNCRIEGRRHFIPRTMAIEGNDFTEEGGDIKSSNSSSMSTPCRRRQLQTARDVEEAILEVQSPSLNSRASAIKDNSSPIRVTLDVHSDIPISMNTSNCDSSREEYQINFSRPAYNVPRLRQHLCYEPKPKPGKLCNNLLGIRSVVVSNYDVYYYNSHETTRQEHFMMRHTHFMDRTT